MGSPPIPPDAFACGVDIVGTVEPSPCSSPSCRTGRRCFRCSRTGWATPRPTRVGSSGESVTVDLRRPDPTAAAHRAGCERSAGQAGRVESRSWPPWNRTASRSPHVVPDEGHGFAEPANRLSFFADRSLLAEHLGGRAQPHDSVRSRDRASPCRTARWKAICGTPRG